MMSQLSHAIPEYAGDALWKNMRGPSINAIGLESRAITATVIKRAGYETVFNLPLHTAPASVIQLQIGSI